MLVEVEIGFQWKLFSQGVYVEELRKKLRIVPISITLDCSYWTSRDDDFQYAIDKTLIDNSAETKIKYFLDFNGTCFKHCIMDFIRLQFKTNKIG